MIAVLTAFSFDFNFGSPDAHLETKVLTGRQIRNWSIEYAFCYYYRGKWHCVDEQNVPLEDYEFHCNSYDSDCYIAKQSYIPAQHYTNFQPDADDIITPPDYEYEATEGSYIPEEKEFLRNIDILYFKRKEYTKSNKGQVFEEMRPLAGNMEILDEMICKNNGFDGQSVVWKCTSRDVNRHMKLAETSISCEGWDGPNDQYIVPGSCFVSYKVEYK